MYFDALENIDAVIALLEQRYGSPRHGNKENLLDELIYIKLSQQTNSPKFLAMYEALQKAYPGWVGLESASQEDLEEILRPGGLHRQRARDLRAMVAYVIKTHGSLDLSWLSSLSIPEVIQYLSTMPGVGIKSAYCVVMYSLGQDVLPVDVHVQRVSERLGLIPAKLSDKKKHQLLADIIPLGKRYSYHVNCVSHGQQTCRKIPKCSQCVIQDFCAFFQSVARVDMGAKELEGQ